MMKARSPPSRVFGCIEEIGFHNVQNAPTSLLLRHGGVTPTTKWIRLHTVNSDICKNALLELPRPTNNHHFPLPFPCPFPSYKASAILRQLKNYTHFAANTHVFHSFCKKVLKIEWCVGLTVFKATLGIFSNVRSLSSDVILVWMVNWNL